MCDATLGVCSSIVLMAADQRKRRLSSTSTSFYYGFQDNNRPKKRDLKSSKHDFDFNTHVSLKWDDNGKRVVAKEDQIGISWRHLTPFIPSAPIGNTKLADVVTVPREVFDLKDLSDVLSYEVWQSILTEKERNLLVQFLPTGVEADKAVEALLSGENFQFGNPCLKWGSSLCSGDLHPDAILQHEKSYKTNKKAYYSLLQQYHENMIWNLQNLKQRCASSNDPQAEIRQVMSRSKRHEMNILPDANGPKCHKPDENVIAMSESLSPIVDENLYYSDNQKLSAIRDAEIQKRMRNQVLMKDKHEKSGMPPNGMKVSSRTKKAEKLQKPNLTPNDGAKYMSYVKISKKQHELVKNMRQSGSSIQSKALNRLLGGLDSSNVKPYEMFVEEEQSRIHEYWLNLANKDLPAALRNWRNRQLKKRHIMNSLWQEMEEKHGFQSKDENMYNPSDGELAPVHDENEETSQGTSDSEGDKDDESTSQNSTSDDEREDSDTRSLKNEPPLQNTPLNVKKELDTSSSLETSSLQNPLNVKKEFDTSSLETPSLQNPSLNVNEQYGTSSSMETQSLQNSPLNVHEECDPSLSMETQSLKNTPLNINKEFDPSSSMETQALQNPTLNVNEQFDTSPTMEDQPMQHPLNVNEEVGPSCTENQSLQNPSLNMNESFDPSLVEKKCSADRPLNDNEDFTPMDLNAENNPVTSDTSDTCSMPAHHVAQTSEASIRISHPGTCTSMAPIVEEMPGSSLKNMWTSIGLPDSYHTRPTTLHTNSGGLGHRHQQVATGQPSHLIDLESDMPEEDSTKDLLNRHLNRHNRHMPFFNPYPNRGRNELLHSVIKPDNFHQEQKKPGAEFHPTNVLLESGSQFPSHFREQLQPPFALDHHHRQKTAQSEVFMHQNIQDGIYSDNNRYSSIQGPEHFSPLNARDWGNARLSNPIQPTQLSSGELMNPTWFAPENRAHGGWSTSDSTVFPTPSLASGSNSDQSLYSVLTQCNLHSRGPYSTLGSAEQMIPPTTYGPEMAGVIPMTTNALPPTVSPFNYLSGGEASTTLKNPNMGWMSLGQQPSTLRDPSGKPFVKSWNQ